MKKPNLISLKEIEKLKIREIENYYSNHYNPGLTKIFRILGFDKVRIVKAEGMYYIDEHRNRILDCWGGYGSLNVGHNHPRILEVIKEFQKDKRVEINMAFYSDYAAALAKNLSEITPGDLNYSVLCNSGAEAVEGALKIAEKYQGKERNKFIYFDNSFHGKTRAALSVTSHKFIKKDFKCLDGCFEIPYGDVNRLENFFKSRKADIGAVIVEPIQGNGGIVVAPDGFLKSVREICTKYNALMIVDEVASGFGRTGRMFAFEYENIIPDIITVAKSLGGGKVPVAAYICSEKVFRKAYGGSDDTALFSTTFGGMGGTCAVAVETLHIIYDEGLIERAADIGEYFIVRLKDLKDKYPDIIKDVRGRGLMIGVEFQDISGIITPGLRPLVKGFDKKLKGAFAGLVVSELLSKYKILAALTSENRNVIRILPPLIITREQADYVTDSLNRIFSKGLAGLIKNKIIGFL
ncbi:MAG: aspartate aminotransferase family protein [Elusimicrobia bacterium]|nr:aspartate aminotransferase family protein [Elusimicrobiota bacterium]